MSPRPILRFAGLAGLVLATGAIGRLDAQPPAARMPAGASALRIAVESVTGKVRYARGGRFRRLTTAARLNQGDTIVADTGSVCKLEFQHPTSRAVLAAVIAEGYTEMTIAQAYQQGESSRTLLDMTQGIMRAGVVQTATPPSFQIRDPRMVAAVRGTEIAELKSSNDRGTQLRMGRIGISRMHDVTLRGRSARAGQGTLKRTERDVRGGALLRAIENAALTHRVILTGPHRHGLEVAFDRGRSFDRVEFNPGEFHKAEGNPRWESMINAQGHSPGGGAGCPFCEERQFKLPGGQGPPLEGPFLEIGPQLNRSLIAN